MKKQGDPDIPALVAGNPGQGTLEEYTYLRDVIRARRPCRLLVFGVGKDSELWLRTNRGGHTVFVEHSRAWIKRTLQRLPGATVHRVRYRTRRKQWRKRLERPDKLLMRDLPADVLAGVWDVIFVDAPPGALDKRPGRMKSIYTASTLIANSPEIDVLLHDSDREVERLYGDTFIGAENLVTQVDTLRHYRVSGTGLDDSGRSGD